MKYVTLSDKDRRFKQTLMSYGAKFKNNQDYLNQVSQFDTYLQNAREIAENEDFITSDEIFQNAPKLQSVKSSQDYKDVLSSLEGVSAEYDDGGELLDIWNNL